MKVSQRIGRIGFAGVGLLLAGLTLAPGRAAAVTATLVGDTYTISSSANAIKGATGTLEVNGAAAPVKNVYLKFDLGTLPVGTTGNDVAKATLTLFVNKVTTPGSFDVLRVTTAAPDAWSEATLNALTAASLTSLSETSAIPVASTDKNRFKTVDLTNLVKAWIDATQTNNGVELIANTVDGLNAKFDSKENGSKSHPPELEIELSPQITSANIVDGSITGSDIAPGTITDSNLASMNWSKLVNVPGAVSGLAGATLAPVNNQISTVASFGSSPSITIGTDGLPLISYYGDLGQLWVRHCNDTACSTSAAAFHDGSFPKDTSITIGADGLGLVSYHSLSSDFLKVVHCGNAACSSSTAATLDSTGNVGRYSSIAIGTDGLGLISYYDLTNGNLKVAHCSNSACSSATVSTIDSGGDVGQYTSIAIGTDGLGLISYYDVTNGDLKVAHCSNTACSSATTSAVTTAGNVGSFASITIGTDGLGLISYLDSTNTALLVDHCLSTACSTTTTTTVDNTGSVGDYSSITIGADGLPVISYYDFTNGDLKLAHCSDRECLNVLTRTVDSIADVGLYTSITIGADGLPVIVYVDSTGSEFVKIAHCANNLCAPYLRRR